MGRLVRYNRGTPPSSTLDIYLNLKERSRGREEEEEERRGRRGWTTSSYIQIQYEEDLQVRVGTNVGEGHANGG